MYSTKLKPKIFHRVLFEERLWLMFLQAKYMLPLYSIGCVHCNLGGRDVWNIFLTQLLDCCGTRKPCQCKEE